MLSNVVKPSSIRLDTHANPGADSHNVELTLDKPVCLAFGYAGRFDRGAAGDGQDADCRVGGWVVTLLSGRQARITRPVDLGGSL